jgi:hypothetical protein
MYRPRKRFGVLWRGSEVAEEDWRAGWTAVRQEGGGLTNNNGLLGAE